MGPLMLDCRHTSLQDDEKAMLAHPLTGGVILFSRNYENINQLKVLISEIRQAAGKPIIIAVDHEGGRVQRFRDGFTALPAMGSIVQLAHSDTEQEALSRACGCIMAYELKSLDIDISFAPVLDLDNVSSVIGDRGFASTPQDVIRLTRAFIQGMNAIGMPATGKHFPGHGSVIADSHVAAPIDRRHYNEVETVDMLPFSTLIKEQLLQAIMPAHVAFLNIDSKPAGFSPFWLQEVLRKRLGFEGVIFSDDLSMEGAGVVGGYLDRANAALDAGCDMILACNNAKGAAEILDGLTIQPDFSRLLRLSGRPTLQHAAKEYAQACALWQSYAD